MKCYNCGLWLKRETQKSTKNKKIYYPAGKCTNYDRFGFSLFTIGNTNCDSGIRKVENE